MIELWEIIARIYKEAPIKVTALQDHLRSESTGEPLSMSQIYRYGENPRGSGSRIPAEHVPALKAVFGPAAEKALREWEWQKQQEIAAARRARRHHG